ncbi:LysR family transcriptional regulator, partial [Streptomyces cavourensis]
VTDAPPVTTVLAWLPENRSRPVADLVRVATSL